MVVLRLPELIYSLLILITSVVKCDQLHEDSALTTTVYILSHMHDALTIDEYKYAE